MLPFQIVVTLLTFIAITIFALLHENAAIVSYHIVFSIGIIPLILAAMVHFLPVLARSKKPNKWINLLPLLALLSGLLITSHLAFPQVVTTGHYFGATVIIIVVANLGIWAFHLKSQCIGIPHPCLDWYLAAIYCLLIALSAIVITYFIPSQRAEFRLLHLHLNTLGFIGITALGTLQVLMPTVAQCPDPAVASRMRQHLKWMVIGTFMIAFCAAWYPKLAWVGVTLLAIPVFGITQSWLQLYREKIFKWNGAAPVLASALSGFVIALVIGTAHAYGQHHFNPIALFIIIFMMPLVMGAASYLLPLWLKPGQQTIWHQTSRAYLAANGALRALIFLVGGILVSLGYETGWYLVALAAGAFLAKTIKLLIPQIKGIT